VFDRFNGSSFDAHDGPVRCCRAVPRSNDPGGPEGDTVTVAEKLLNTEYDCQTVAAHEASTFLKVYMELDFYFFVSRTNKRHHHLM
jgi:hypothetical protein